LAALLGEDTRIYGAVQQAVDRTLERIEQCAKARITRQGVTAYENTHNLVVAKFLLASGKQPTILGKSSFFFSGVDSGFSGGQDLYR
jgi:conjugative relaxase-like TrwC/TraI family protein